MDTGETLKHDMKRCPHCGELFTPKSPEQQFCLREENPACYFERQFLTGGKASRSRKTGRRTANGNKRVFKFKIKRK